MDPLRQQNNVQPHFAGDPEIEIEQFGEDYWAARIVFLDFDSSDLNKASRIREAKRMISMQYGIAVELLEFKEVLEKVPVPEGVYARILIGKIEIGQGPPVVRLRPTQTSRGELLHEMIAEVDFYYLDEFEEQITADRIELELNRAGVDITLCNFDVINEALNTVIENRNYVKKLVVARGELPSIGRDAEIEYTFYIDPSGSDSISDYTTGRKVKSQDIICQKIPARDGRRRGCTVRGDPILPIQGLDFELATGEGAKLSLDGNTVTALREGITIILRKNRRIYTLAGEKTVTEKLQVSVKPLVEFDANDILNIALEESVGIIGDLKEGSSIKSDGEVFLGGDLERGTKVSAGDDVFISGQILGGEIQTNGSMYSEGDAANVSISATKDIHVKGKLKNANVSADRIRVKKLEGSNIEAGRKLIVDEVGDDAIGRRTAVKLGRQDYYQHKLGENRDALVDFRESLERIKSLFGVDLLEQLNGSNQQQLLVRYIKRLRQYGQNELEGETIDSLKRLLETVHPLQEVIEEKKDEISVLEKKASDDREHRPVIVVREKIRDEIDVTIGDRTETVVPAESGTAITTSEDGGVRKYELKAPSGRKAKRFFTSKASQKKKHN
ncbi:hypothetical protein CEE37_00510 [candidate division LCP-89 bacterium B3_LCP]|uniref:Flagellar Assembly Protein A N-terminal region domain-containing protein n=1 Tax=candidate division LCP-89 bacterium B3_LCP TaxID=2012998 RepID=A0A532V4R7_UNCL8|nr:MAG: hypothetical protein CEE37_00510 [candidate division LCP-89 bacterium B3_LCP]